MIFVSTHIDPAMKNATFDSGDVRNATQYVKSMETICEYMCGLLHVYTTTRTNISRTCAYERNHLRTRMVPSVHVPFTTGHINRNIIIKIITNTSIKSKSISSQPLSSSFVELRTKY